MARSSGLKSPITIRDYDDSDLDAVIELARELQRHEMPMSNHLKPPSMLDASYVEKTTALLAKHKGRFLIAVSGDQVIGYATLYLHVEAVEEPEDFGYTYASVGDLVVAKTARGQGVGKLLLQDCEALARAAGQKYFQLSVLGKNHGAREFYSAAGLEEFYVRLEKKL
jgi:ribosomal protein S18 acetylase RimI-like enzyme